MLPIEALLMLPEKGEPRVLDSDVNAALMRVSARFVRRRKKLWSLTEEGSRFLVQFRPRPPSTLEQVMVRLVIAADGPIFHLDCDGERLLKVPRTELRRCLQEIKAANPGVKIAFDFRPHQRVA